MAPLREFANDIEVLSGLDAQTIDSDTTTAGEIIDTKDYDGGLTFLFTAEITDGTYTPLIEEGDEDDLSDAAAVDDANLTATEASQILSGDASTQVSKLGYFGSSKRYVRASLVSTTTTDGAICACIVAGKKEVKAAA